MGWDAISSVGKNKAIIAKFKEAEKLTISMAGFSDASLCLGRLGCKISGEMLEIATGENVYNNSWSAEKVKQLYQTANWDFQYNEEDDWAYWSAWYFLAVCAKNELSISFSW
jgi:hypothetical protein